MATNEFESEVIKSKFTDVKDLLKRFDSNENDKLNDSRTKLHTPNTVSCQAIDTYGNNRLTHFKQIRYMIICGMKLKMNDLSLATAAMIYHKFFHFCELSKFDPYLIVASSIYLGSKIEEEHLKLRDVVNVCYNTLHTDKPPLAIDLTYWSLRNSVITCEFLLARVLGFNFNFNHPHKYLLNYLESLRQWIPLDIRKRLPIPETCWHMLKDLLHTDILLKYRPQEIAISVIYLVLMCYGVKVPYNDIAQSSWWKALDDKVTRTLMFEIIRDILHVYEMDDEIFKD